MSKVNSQIRYRCPDNTHRSPSARTVCFQNLLPSDLSRAASPPGQRHADGRGCDKGCEGRARSKALPSLTLRPSLVQKQDSALQSSPQMLHDCPKMDPMAFFAKFHMAWIFFIFPSPFSWVSCMVTKQSEASKSGPHPPASPTAQPHWVLFFPPALCFKEWALSSCWRQSQLRRHLASHPHVLVHSPLCVAQTSPPVTLSPIPQFTLLTASITQLTRSLYSFLKTSL